MGLYPQLFRGQHTMLPLHLLFLVVSVWAGGEKTYLVKTGEPKSCDVSKNGCDNCTESHCTRENGCLWTQYTDSPDGPVFGFCQDYTVISPETDGPEDENEMMMNKKVESDVKSRGPCSGEKHGEICEKIGTVSQWCRGPWPACGKKTGLCMYDVCKVFRTEPCAGKKKGDVCEVEGTAGTLCRAAWPLCGKRTGRCTGRWGDVCKLEAPGSGSDCSKRKEGAVCDPLCKAAFCKPNTGRYRKKRCVFVGSSRPVARG